MKVAFQENFKNILEHLEMNPIDFSEWSGIPLETVLGLLSGEVRINEELAEKIANVFGVKKEHIL